MSGQQCVISVQMMKIDEHFELGPRRNGNLQEIARPIDLAYYKWVVGWRNKSKCAKRTAKTDETLKAEVWVGDPAIRTACQKQLQESILTQHS